MRQDVVEVVKMTQKSRGPGNKQCLCHGCHGCMDYAPKEKGRVSMATLWVGWIRDLLLQITNHATSST